MYSIYSLLSVLLDMAEVQAGGGVGKGLLIPLSHEGCVESVGNRLLAGIHGARRLGFRFGWTVGLFLLEYNKASYTSAKYIHTISSHIVHF